MKKIFALAVITLAINFAGKSQPAMSGYVEILGPGVASINFDTRFTASESGIGGRVGFGGFKLSDVGVVFIPVGLNYLLGKDGKNYFEIGGGVTPIIASEEFSTDKSTFRTTFGHALFGYRLQPANGGFTFRAFLSPVFGKGFFLPYYGGVSLGYKFGGKRSKNDD